MLFDEILDQGVLIGKGTEAYAVLLNKKVYKVFFIPDPPNVEDLKAAYSLVQRAFPDYPCLYEVESENPLIVSCPYIEGHEATNADASLVAAHNRLWLSRGLLHMDIMNPKNVLVNKDTVVFIDHDYVELI